MNFCKEGENNICIIASGDFFSNYGGGQVYVKNLVAGLQKRAYCINIISMQLGSMGNETVTEIKDFDGAKVWKVMFAQDNFETDKPYELQDVFLGTLSDLLISIAPDVVHANGWKYGTSKVCKELSIPCVITAHHGGIVCPNGMLLDQHEAICRVPASTENCLECALHFVPGGTFWTPIARILPKKTALEFAQTLNKVRNIPYVSPAFITPLIIEKKLQQIDAIRSSSVRIIAPSQAIGNALKRNNIAVEKVTVIPHGITPLEAKLLADGLPDRPLRFGYVGRITYVKGLHVLMDALKLLPRGSKYELHIYGEAVSKSEKQYYRKIQKQSEGLNVYWYGKISYDEIEKAYHSFDLLVLPSICHEVFGLTVVEALSAGRPVLATRCGGPEDILRDGRDGVLVEPNDPKSLGEALAKMIQQPEIIQKMVEEIQPVFSLEKHIEMLEKLYFDMMKDKQ